MKMSKKSAQKFRSGYLGVAMIIILMLVTLYMAFAFPFNFLQMKQTETTEIKAVMVLGMAGEESPSPEAYFVSEAPPENLNMIGYDQLTEVGIKRFNFELLRWGNWSTNLTRRKISPLDW